MTINEVSERYRIPVSILKKYESWELCSDAAKKKGAWMYDQTDLNCLSQMMTLYELGFGDQEVERYMRLALCSCETTGERVAMLRSRRSQLLDEIHQKQAQLDRLDYLCFEVSHTEM